MTQKIRVAKDVIPHFFEQDNTASEGWQICMRCHVVRHYSSDKPWRLRGEHITDEASKDCDTELVFHVLET